MGSIYQVLTILSPKNNEIIPYGLYHDVTKITRGVLTGHKYLILFHLLIALFIFIKRV